MKQSRSHSISETVRERIARGVYSLGEKLPTEQALSREFSAGRSTIREAMQLLKAKGLLSIRPGAGTVVISKDGDSSGSMRQWLVENRDNLGDFMEVRVAIESLAVRLFIAKQNDAMAAQLAEAQSLFEQAVEAGDVAGMAINDAAFHTAIALGSGNPLLQGINRQLIEAFQQYRLATFEDAHGRASAVKLHRDILRAIQLRDTQTALFFIQEHLNNSLRNALGMNG